MTDLERQEKQRELDRLHLDLRAAYETKRLAGRGCCIEQEWPLQQRVWGLSRELNLCGESGKCVLI